jgi:hypothetical protein
MTKIGGLAPPLTTLRPPTVDSPQAKTGGTPDKPLATPPGGPSVDTFERSSAPNDFARLFGAPAGAQAEVVGSQQAYEELSGASKRKVAATAELLKNGSPAAVETEIRKSLAQNPGQLWNMMGALKASDPKAYQAALGALQKVFANPQGLDLAKVIAEPYSKAPELLADALGTIAADPAAAKGVQQAVAQSLKPRGSIDFEPADLRFFQAAKGLEGPGGKAVQQTLLDRVGAQMGRPGQTLESAERLLEVQADSMGYLRKLADKARNDPGGYKTELQKLFKEGLRPDLKGMGNLFVGFATVGDSDAMNTVRADVMRHLHSNLEKAQKDGNTPVAAGNAEEIMGMLRKPGVGKFMLSDETMRKELRTMMSSVASVSGNMGRKLVGSLVQQIARDTALVLKRTNREEFKGSQEAGDATMRLGFLLASAEDALEKAEMPQSDVGPFVLKQLGEAVVDLIPGGSTAGKYAGKIADWGLGKALDSINDGRKPFRERMLDVASGIFHAVYDPNSDIGKLSTADPTGRKLRQEYSDDAMDFQVKLNGAYEAYKTKEKDK